MTSDWRSSAWVEVAEEPGILILRVCGELDAESRDVVEPVLLAAITSAPKVVLDLGDLRLCDSSGVVMFATAHEKAEADGRVLIVGNIPPTIGHVFAISGLNQTLNTTE